MNVFTFGNEWIGYCETVSGGAGTVSSILCTISRIILVLETTFTIKRYAFFHFRDSKCFYAQIL